MSVVYHVTKTTNISKIAKQGLRRFMTSNWIKAGNHERYGNGEIFVFEALPDAIRWAGRMDWAFHQSTGSGKISIVAVNAPDHPWEPDEADPLSQAGSEGRWLKSNLPVPATAILAVHIVTTEMVHSAVFRIGPTG